MYFKELNEKLTMNEFAKQYGWKSKSVLCRWIQEIGKSNFYLVQNSTTRWQSPKYQLTYITFQPHSNPLRGIKGVKKETKTKVLDALCHLVVNLSIKLNHYFFYLRY